jgi:hypothetical protein
MDKTANQLSNFCELPTLFLNNMPDMLSLNPCVLAPEGADTKMTWNSFASACLWRQSKKKACDIYSAICKHCKIGKEVKKGKKVSPPDGMTIIEPDGWIEQPIKQPPKKWIQASKYNFHMMEIGETYKDNIENAKRCRSARRNIAVRHGREFVTEIIDNEIRITRTK